MQNVNKREMSITSALNGQLLLVCTFCVVLLVGVLLHRVLSIICKILLAGMMFLPDVSSIDEPLKKFAQQGLVASVVRFAILVVVTVLQLCTVILNIVFTIVYGLLPLVGLALLMVLMHERWSDSMMVLTDVLNGQVGSMLHQIVLAPLTIFDAVGTYVLPVFNLVVFVLVRIPVQILVWVLQGNGVSHLMDALATVCAAASELMAASKLFVNSNGQSCNTEPVCTAFGGPLRGSGECVMVDLVTQSTACLNVAAREFNFMPTFIKLQQTSGNLNMFVGDTCSFLAVAANVILFPISDLEAWRAIDRVLNAFLYAVISGPGLAIARCGLAGGFEARPAMCTRDFGPAFDKLSASGVHLGNALTNWMDAAYLFLFSLTDIRSVCAAATSLNEILWSDKVAQRLWGTNATVLTRMDADSFAVSDGNSVVFVKSVAGQLRKTYSPNLWPTPINQSLGIARAVLPSGLSNGLMGCSCAAAPFGRAGIVVQCSIITQDGTAWVMPVRWSLAAETQLLTCDRIRIVVQSVRWPHRRVLANTLNANGEDTSKNSALNADVAIFIIPICGAADGFKAMACWPEKSFTRGICFPYCMALRLVHEGFGPITMRGAMEWQQGVLLAMRSCVPIASSSDTTTVAGVQTTCTSAAEGSASTDELTTCTYAYSCTTMVVNKTAVPGYRVEFPVQPKASWDGSHLLLMGQPLVVGGDVFMRMFADSTQNYVDFPTVVGNQVGEFTVEANSPVGIPVTAPTRVPKYNIEMEKRGEVFEPIGYVQSMVPYNPATLTPTALWYASNPSYDWIRSMAVYCASKGHEVQTQIMILSNYAPLRLWRVLYHDYENCIISPESGEHVCAPQIAEATSLELQIQIMSSKGLEGSTTLYDMCSSDVQFNLWVVSLNFAVLFCFVLFCLCVLFC